MKSVDHIIENEAEILGFLRSRYPFYHLSNVFFRDIQYGIQTLLERKGFRVGYTDAERIARKFAGNLEKKKILVPVDGQSWVLYYEDFKTVSAKRTAHVKPAGPKPAVARPAGGLPPLKSAAPAGTAKPATGLPPLKSSAPAGGARPAAGLPPSKISLPTTGGGTDSAAPQSVPPEQSAPVPKKTEQSQKQQETSSGQQDGKKGLPPITSSVPAGGKK